MPSLMEKQGAEKGSKRMQRQMAQGEVKRPEEEEDNSLLGMRRLPHELLVRIVAFLPVYKLLELQTVCKSWPSLYQSPQMSSQFAPRETWLVMQRNFGAHSWEQELVAFCPTLNRWCHLPLSFGDELYLTLSFMASAGGLIVSSGQDKATRRDLLVSNILTKATNLLHRPSSYPDNFTPSDFERTMLADPLAGFYQVILISTENMETGLLRGHFMQVYDSRTQSWEWKDRNSHHSDGQALVYEPTSKCWKWKVRHRRGSTRNVLDDDLFVLDKRNGAMYTYNAERCMWSTLKTPSPSCTTAKGLARLNLLLETIVKCKGRLLLAGVLELEELCLELVEPYPGVLELEERLRWTVEGLGVWEWKSVGQGSGRWVELARTPPEFWEAYRCRGPVSLWCQFRCSVANDNLICMTGVDTTLLPGNSWPPLAYDLDRGSWRRLPFYGDKADYLGLFAYEPSWNAVP